jgi:hypothetical protein
MQKHGCYSLRGQLASGSYACRRRRR